MRSVRDRIKRTCPQTPKGGLNAVSSRLFKTPLEVWGLLFILFSISVSAQDIKLPPRPDPPHLVNDLAGMLSMDEANSLERKLTAYSDSTSTQIAVVIINSLEGAEIAQYATELGAKWGIGVKGKDNGVLLLISKSDHQIFIATGRGVEANLPDITAKQIVDHVIKPQFKADHYYEGINAATDQMIASLSGQFVNDNITDRTDRGAGNAKWIALIIVIIFLLIMFFGGRGGQTMGGGSIWPWFFIGSMFGGSGGDNDGGGFGGGDSGGGFGGFGGGDFGGGGAGGSW